MRQPTKKSSFTNKVIPITVISILTLIPTLVAVGGYLMLGPDGFWEKFAAIGCGVFFLGTIQIIFLIFGVWAILTVTEKGWS